MWSESGLRTAGDVCVIIGFIGTALKVFWYFASARPTETYQSFHTRMEFGEFRSPAIRARMEQDPEFRAHMEVLLRSRAFRLKEAEVKATAASLRSAIEAAKPFVARVKAARAAREFAVEAAATAKDAVDDDDDDDDAAAAAGEGEESAAVAEASARLRAVSRDDAGVLARVTEMMAKHRAAKAAVARIILAVSRYPGRDPATREGGAGVRGRGGSAVAVAVAEPNIRAGTGASAAAAVEPLEMDNSAASMEEGRPLL